MVGTCSLNSTAAPLDPLPLVRSYAWGLDLADGFEEAGGIGGLLVFTDHAPLTDTYHYPAYDGNGNVTGLVQSSGSPTALYEYSPFGELIRSAGPSSRLNPFQFSTKFFDQETGLSYYGHRYYSASLGRWVNRDPIEEDDGPNMYAFVRNRSVDLFDALGMLTSAEQGTAGGVSGGMSSSGSQAVSYLQQVRKWADAWNDMQDLISIATDMFDVIGAGDEVFDKLYREGRERLSNGPSGRMGKKHHSISEFLGGESGQDLFELGGGKHVGFHQALDQELAAVGIRPGGMGGKNTDYQRLLKNLKSDRTMRRNAMRAILRASFKIDDKYGGNGSLPTTVLMHLLDGRWLKGKGLSRL